MNFAKVDWRKELKETTMSLLKELTDELDRMCNAQFDSTEFKHLLSLPLTMKRAQFYIIQNALYTANRRDC